MVDPISVNSCNSWTSLLDSPVFSLSVFSRVFSAFFLRADLFRGLFLFSALFRGLYFFKRQDPGTYHPTDSLRSSARTPNARDDNGLGA